MDTRRILTTFLMVGAVMLLAPQVIKWWNGDKGTGATTMPAVLPMYSNPAAVSAAEQGAPAKIVLLGDSTKAGKDKLSIDVNTITAAIEDVKLNANDYSETVHGADAMVLMKAEPGLPKPYATLSVHVVDAGKPLPVFDLYAAQYIWKVVDQSKYSTTLLCTLEDGLGKPLIEVTKTFTVHPDNYEVLVSHAVKNMTDRVLDVQIDQMAATDLPRDSVQMDDRFYHAATLSTGKKLVEGNTFNFTHAEFKKLPTMTKDIGQMNDFSPGKDPTLWVAASNRFFAAITRPVAPGGSGNFALEDGRPIGMPRQIASANIDELKSDDSDPTKVVAGIRLTGANMAIAAKSTTELPLSVFFGPKKRDILDGKYTAPAGTLEGDYSIYQYIKLFQFSSGGCYGFLTFDSLGFGLLWLLDFLANTVAFHNYGIAIIILVIIVRACLHPLTRASQINMAVMSKKMSVIKPQIDAMKKKYAKDPTKEREEQMRIYRENQVNPAGGLLGCLPMLLQMPIWIALYTGLRVDLDLRHASFIPGWIVDLASPDALIRFAPVHIPLLSSLLGPIDSFNLLPILLGVVFFFQMKMQMASQPKPADEQQAQMQNISKYMFFLFPLFLYNAPSGLNLYYFASTGAGLVDTYIVRKTLRKRGILPPKGAPANA